MKTAALLLAGLVLAPIGAVAAPCADLAADVAAMQRCSDRKLEAAGASLEQLSADVDRLRARRDAGAKKIALSEFRQDYFNGRPTAVLGFHGMRFKQTHLTTPDRTLTILKIDSGVSTVAAPRKSNKIKVSAAGQTPAALLTAFLRANRARFPTDAAFAEALRCSPGRLSQILHGGPANVRPALAVAIHRETRGALPGNVLRPDLWRRPADVPLEGDQ